MNDNRETTKAYIQLNAILSILPDEQKSKIPKDIMDKILNAKLKGYIFRYDYDKDLLEQDLSDKAKEMLFDIYIQYLADKDKLENVNDKIKCVEEINSMMD